MSNKMIIKQKCYDLKAHDYLWNGSILQMMSERGRIITTVPKKYYNEILFTPHITVKSTVSNTIPQIVKKDIKDSHVLIIMDKHIIDKKLCEYKGKTYIELSRKAKIKHDNGFDVQWVDAVLYTNTIDDTLFMRSTKEFDSKFEEIK